MPAAHVVTVGAPSLGGPTDAAGTALAAALGGAGIPVVSRAFVEEDEAALERALGPEDALTVVFVAPGGTAGDAVRRVVARAAGARLVLSDRFLAALEDRYRRLERPLPRAAERLALLPQGALTWAVAGSDPGWALESGARAFVILPAEVSPRLLDEHLLPFVQARFAGRGAVVLRTLRTVGVTPADLEERLAHWLGAGEGRGAEVGVSTLPADGEVWVRLRARGATPAEAAQAWRRRRRRSGPRSATTATGATPRRSRSSWAACCSSGA